MKTAPNITSQFRTKGLRTGNVRGGFSTDNIPTMLHPDEAPWPHEPKPFVDNLAECERKWAEAYKR